jgi:biotin carboxyl carrier protein
MRGAKVTDDHALRPPLPQVGRDENASGSEEEDNPALLPVRPPPVVLRVLAALLVGAWLVGLVIVGCLRFPDSVEAKFQVAPDEGSDPLKAPRRGTLESVRVKDSDSFEAGDVLFTLRTEELARAPRLEEELREMEAMDTALEQRYVQAVEASKEKAKSFQREYNLARGRAETANRVYDAAGKRAARGIGTRTEADNARLSYEGAQRDAEAARRGAEDARVAMAELEANRKKEVSERTIARSQKLAELEELKASVDTQASVADGGAPAGPLVVAVRAPFRGSVVSLQVKQPGAVVDRGDLLGLLAKEGAKLRAEIEIPNDAAGRVAKGQNARLLFGSFPYSRYGVRTAKLTWLSAVGEKGVFRAFGDLDQGYFEYHGQRLPVRPGMQGDARILVGARTLLEAAFEPLRALREDWRTAP